MGSDVPRETIIGTRPPTIERVREYMEKENKKYPRWMTILPMEGWPAVRPNANAPVEIWRSREFLAQVYETPTEGIKRLSVNRTMIEDSGAWSAEITWEELQRVKSECGFGKMWACELYPHDDEVVNVANMRHLFIGTTGEMPEFAWRKNPK